MPRRSKDDCYEDIKRRVLATELEPGSDLEEVALSEHYGMSRTPLREVFQRLAGDGFVQLTANRGAKVASMDVAVLRTFFQTAPLIYATIARLAAENRTEAQLAALAQTQSDFTRSVQDLCATEAALHNHAFHRCIGLMAQNEYLMACLNRLLIDHTRLGQTFYRPAAPAETALIATAVEQHDAMIDAFEARDAEAAVALTRAHWDLSRNRMERFVRPAPLPVELDPLKPAAPVDAV